MHDLGLDELCLDRSRGERLNQEDYDRDFWERESAIRDRGSWKFERLQHFEEQNDPSRDALGRGEWEESLRLLEAERDDLLAMVRAEEARGAPFHRVRVVEEPPTPYLQWELHALRVQAECGMGVRVVDAGKVRPLEADGLLPEVVVLGGQTLYEVVYTDTGVLDGAVRFTEPRLVESWERFIRDLYEGGEDVISYVDRYVAQLPPPRLARRTE
ncbi:DUF6879 family protein [Streptomyces sp. 6N223]|uniref:DUF6879 family protein n=1 Tax=Streptomyces sp. 6N223 TaxID=3457412 RepID=UPI003FD279FE